MQSINFMKLKSAYIMLFFNLTIVRTKLEANVKLKFINNRTMKNLILFTVNIQM